ncbi:MAG: hypothetical protein J7K82_04405 [Thermoproteales archaeon]|nr:hypothetical protein [Thermoproteales archaeon]
MSEEAHIGKRGEELLVYLINNNMQFAQLFRNCVSKLLNVNLRGKIRAKRDRKSPKTDVEVLDESEYSVGISLKTVKKGGRPDDHLDRRWLDRPGRYTRPWTEVLQMPTFIRDIIWQGIMRKARHKNVALIEPQHQKAVRNFLIKNLDSFLEEAFRMGEQNLKLLGVLEYENGKILYLFALDDIIRFIKYNIINKGLTFSARIYMGDYIQIQRKAGDGSRINKRIPKTDPRHPGNQIQVKLLTLKLKNDAVQKLKHCEIKISEIISRG